MQSSKFLEMHHTIYDIYSNLLYDMPAMKNHIECFPFGDTRRSVFVTY